MNTLQENVVEKEVIGVITDYCHNLGLDIPEKINADFVPGHFIKSHVLLTAISDIAVSLNVEIPNDCYIFFEKNERKQLSIKETVQKILKVAINEK